MLEIWEETEAVAAEYECACGCGCGCVCPTPFVKSDAQTATEIEVREDIYVMNREAYQDRQGR